MGQIYQVEAHFKVLMRLFLWLPLIRLSLLYHSSRKSAHCSSSPFVVEAPLQLSRNEVIMKSSIYNIMFMKSQNGQFTLFGKMAE